MLDEFYYNLSNEDFAMKYFFLFWNYLIDYLVFNRYGLLAWPWKIRTMLEQVEEQHKEDEERFKKLQVQDTSTLNDKMDQLTVRFIFFFEFKIFYLFIYKLDVCC